MDITCEVCDNGTASDGNPCGVCGGDGIITLTDAAFGRCTVHPAVFGIVWNNMLIRLSDIEDKVDDVMDKCNDIKEIITKEREKW